MRGSELLKQGKLDQAQRAFRAALDIDPDSPRVLALLGLAHFRANEFADARGLYEQLVERAPTDASHRLNLGLVYLKLNDADRAISALEASRALDPSQGRAVSYLGLAYARGGRYAEAYRAFLIAGQNELAIEIESNLIAAERDRIHSQLGRTPHGPLPTSAPTAYPGAPGAQRTAAPASPPSTPAPTSVPRTPTPTPTATPIPMSTETAIPTATPMSTGTPMPSGMSMAMPTATQAPLPMPVATPMAVQTPVPTATPMAVQTPVPMAMQSPVPTATPMPTRNPTPTPNVVQRIPTIAPAAGEPGSRTPTPTGVPRTPTPTGVARTPTPHVVPRTPTPLPGSASADPSARTQTASNLPAELSSRAQTPIAGARTPTPPGVPRTKPPSAPPGKRKPSQEMPAEAPADSSSSVASVHDIQGKIHIDVASATAAAPQDTGRASESMQFVMPRAEPSRVIDPGVRPDPSAPQQALDGPSMISRAVASATPLTTVGPRTRSGGTPPRPLSELATDELIRPDESEDTFEISANGALIIRVTERVLTRLDGVGITGGDLSYEQATRRSRGHNTDEPFDYGGSQLYAVSGRGYLIAVPHEQPFSAVLLDDDILYLREDLVFAFQAQLRWENGNVPGLRGRLPVVQFRGNGALAMRLRRPLVRVKLPAQGVVFIDADRLAGWIGRVIPRAVVPPPGGPLGTMCVECTGEGVVLVEDTPREVVDAPRITAKWPRVTVEPFLGTQQMTAPLPVEVVLSDDALTDQSFDPLADDTAPTHTTADPGDAAEAPEVIDDRDRLDDL